MSNSLNLDIDTSIYDTPSDFIDDRISKIKKNINKEIKIKSSKNQVSKKIKNIRNNINLSTIPENLETESEIIQEHIEQFTIILAGTQQNISFKEIVISINTNSVPNLTLIDLPGLVMVACEDQGQPADIKKQM